MIYVEECKKCGSADHSILYDVAWDELTVDCNCCGYVWKIPPLLTNEEIKKSKKEKYGCD